MAAARSRGTRRLAVVVLAVVAIIGAIAVAVPFLISSEAVKKRISDQITHWTGRTFTFEGDAKLRLFPYLTVRLQDARLANPGGRNGEPFIAAANMTGKVEILPLLMGRLEFAEFRLASPTINLDVDASGAPNWVLDQGVVGTLASKGDSELPSDDPSPPSPRAEVGLGRFIIRDGTVNYRDARNGTSEKMTDVDVDLVWQNTKDAANGHGTFVWRDEPVTFRGDMNAPLSLLAGGDSPLRLTVEAAPASLSFEGMARQFDGMQIEGQATLKVPSVSGFARWTGGLAETALIGSASISGQVSWAAATLSLGEAAIDLDGNAGEGALTATLVHGRPSLQGTLDFARFDLTPQASSLSAAIDAGGTWRDEPIRLPLVTTADVDLRLSAGSASIGGTDVGPVAASLLVKDGSLRAEIGEAHLGEGLFEASLIAEVRDGGLSAAASLKADGLPADAIAGFFGVTGISGMAEATLDLAGKGSTWGDVVASLAGSGSLSVEDGSLEGVDFAAVPQAITDPAATAAGVTGFSRATAQLAVLEGVVSSEDIRIEGAGYALDLAARIDLEAASVEGRGVITLEEDPPRDVPFLVNGSWGALVFHPDFGGTLPREDGGRADSPLPTDG